MAAAVAAAAAVSASKPRRVAYKDARDEEASPSPVPSLLLENVGPEVLGRHKWLGAATNSSGVMLGMAGHARSILRIDPYDDDVRVIEGPLNRRGINRYKWLRGVSRKDGSCLGLPMHGDAVLKVFPDGEQVELVGTLSKTEYKWHGGCVGANGCAYGVPCNAESVLKVGTDDSASYFGHLPGNYKWYGGILRNDSMYCIPFSGPRVLKVNLWEDSCSLIGPSFRGLAKWHGGLLARDGRTIYGFPAHASSVLMITGEDEIREIGELKETHNGGRYKYGGGCATAEAVYGIPSDATSVLKIVGSTVTTFGRLEARNNKWQNGQVGRDGRIYCVPCDADNVLVIDPSTDALQLVECATGPDKFQGGSLDIFGRIWCIPENSRQVMRITPTAVSDAVFIDAYMTRLKLLEQKGTKRRDHRDGPDHRDILLDEIVESHLANIPFENIDQHCAEEDSSRRGRLLQLGSLSRVALYEKLLVRRRGGDCFELNCGLLYLLEAIGYSVELVPCRVFAGKERGRQGRPGYRAAPSHHALLVDKEWFVDVGFGEGPIAPIRYRLLDGEQVTPEGMRSRIIALGDKLQLEWNHSSSDDEVEEAWIPRLQWDREFQGKRPENLRREREFLLGSDYSSLNRKLVVSRLTRQKKVTVAGSQLKITEPRFSSKDNPIVTFLDDLGKSNDHRRVDSVRQAILEHFGIPLRETVGLDLAPSRSSPPVLWDHL